MNDGTRPPRTTREMMALSPATSRRLPIPVRSFLAVLVWLSAYGLTLALQPWIERTTFVFFWIAVIYTAWAAGLVPSLLVSFASILAVHYHFIEPRGSFAPWSVSELLTFTIFVVASTTVSALTSALARAQRRAEAFARELGDHAQRLEEQATLLQDQQMELEQQKEEAQMLAEEAEEANDRLALANSALSESDARWRALADAAPVLIWTADAQGRRDWSNRQWLQFTGRTLEEQMADGWLEGVHADDVERVLATCRRHFAARQPFTVEYRLRRHDGTYRHVLDNGAPRLAPSGEFLGFIGSCLDITERYEAERAVEEASRAKSEFLTTMSHELRTPLNAIGGYAELLEMELRGPVTEAQREDLRRIRRNQQHLLGLINDILNYSRIDAGRVPYQFEAVALDPVLAALREMIEPQARAKSLSYEYLPCDSSLRVRVDVEKLRQVVLNLLSNAVKFTPAGGTVSLRGVDGADGRVLVVVRDSGPGIPTDKQAIIFEPFVQLGRTLSAGAEGTGLGLAISRELARGMGGDLSVRSEDGDGAEFLLELPKAE